MARFCPLFSSSSGNSIYIGDGDTNILIDAGVSCAKLTASLQKIGISLSDISAVFVTHEHTDHIAGLSVLCKKNNLKLYMSRETANALKDAPYAKQINITDTFTKIGDMCITRFNTSHDCVGSSGYRIDLKSRSFAVCTDTGIVTDEIRTALNGCELVLIESNHDVNLLTKGPYPLALKRRILSKCGHLSNAACAEELPALVQNGTSRIILGHLSLHNNILEAAKSAARIKLLSAGFTEGEDYLLYVAPPAGGKMFSF